ncbi:MAG: sulfite exporter TauE/SafE family protein [Promethearchaeota archaeon]
MEGFIIVLLIGIAFICEFLDSSLGMGYGTTLTPILILFNFKTEQIVPAVLFSEFFTGLIAAGFHILFKNIQLGSRAQKVPKSGLKVINKDGTSGLLFNDEVDFTWKSLFEKYNNLTDESKVVLLLSLFGVLGAIIGTSITSIYTYHPLLKMLIKIYIGVIVISMGIIILYFKNRPMLISMKRIKLVGVIAGINKAISGGGYGPIAVSGQIVSGMEGPKAVASTSLSEGLTCLASILTYVIWNLGFGGNLDNFVLAPYLIIGAILSTPFAALTTKKLKTRNLVPIVGGATILLGIFSLVKIIFPF